MKLLGQDFHKLEHKQDRHRLTDASRDRCYRTCHHSCICRW